MPTISMINNTFVHKNLQLRVSGFEPQPKYTSISAKEEQALKLVNHLLKIQWYSF